MAKIEQLDNGKWWVYKVRQGGKFHAYQAKELNSLEEAEIYSIEQDVLILRKKLEVKELELEGTISRNLRTKTLAKTVNEEL